jgi:pyruvate dehydrogenase (quinone)
MSDASDVLVERLIAVAAFNDRVMKGAHMNSLVDLAIRTALTSRGISHITIPVDVQVQEVKQGRSPRNPVHHTSAVSAYFDQLPARIELEHAADILHRRRLNGQRPWFAVNPIERRSP